jgi:hypothetical protein
MSSAAQARVRTRNEPSNSQPVAASGNPAGTQVDCGAGRSAAGWTEEERDWPKQPQAQAVSRSDEGSQWLAAEPGAAKRPSTSSGTERRGERLREPSARSKPSEPFSAASRASHSAQQAERAIQRSKPSEPFSAVSRSDEGSQWHSAEPGAAKRPSTSSGTERGGERPARAQRTQQAERAIQRSKPSEPSNAASRASHSAPQAERAISTATDRSRRRTC